MRYATKFRFDKPGTKTVNFHLVHEQQPYMVRVTLETKRAKKCNLIIVSTMSNYKFIYFFFNNRQIST